MHDASLGREDEAGSSVAFGFGEVHRRVRRAGIAEIGLPVGQRRPSAGTRVQVEASTPRSQPEPVTFQKMRSSSCPKPIMPVIS